MKIALIADSHFDQHSRFEECYRIHEWIADDMRARGVHLVTHAGDVYERKSTPLERQAVADWIQRCAEFAQVVIARGNHDALDDLPLLERLATRHLVRVVETAGTLFVHAPERDAVALAVLGWPQRANVHALAGAQAKDGVEQVAVDALRAVLRGMGDFLEEQDCPRILLAHAMVRGSRVSTGQPLVGCDFELGIEDLALARADFYALGHVHMGNEWDIAGAPAVYPGSPRRTAFGELEPKGYVVVEFDGTRLVGWERVPTPCTPMVHVDAQYVDAHVCLPGDQIAPAGLYGVSAADIDACRGAEVRLRYHVAAAHREAARADALELRDKLVAAGALHVTVEEELVVETRARTLEVAQATTLAEKLAALWSARGWDPGTRREALIAKAQLLEEAVNAT